jgi:hypothetical protein
MTFSLLRGTGFSQVRLARSSRAKTKHGQDAGRVNGSAIHPTEDAAGRRFAAARTVPGSTDWTSAPGRNICAKPQKALAHFVGQNGKVDNFSPTIANSCKSAKKHHKRRSAHR